MGPGNWYTCAQGDSRSLLLLLCAPSRLRQHQILTHLPLTTLTLSFFPLSRYSTNNNPSIPSLSRSLSEDDFIRRFYTTHTAVYTTFTYIKCCSHVGNRTGCLNNHRCSILYAFVSAERTNGPPPGFRGGLCLPKSVDVVLYTC